MRPRGRIAANARCARQRHADGGGGYSTSHLCPRFQIVEIIE